MVTLQWSYYEIEDTDYTGVEIRLIEHGQLVEAYANFDRHDSRKEVWGNQTETFGLPTLQAARQFILSSGCYVLVPLKV